MPRTTRLTTRPNSRPLDADSIVCPRGHYIGQAGQEFPPGPACPACAIDAASAEAEAVYIGAQDAFDNGASLAEVNALLSRLD